MVVVFLVVASREPASAGGWSASSKVSCPAEIISDEEVFHGRESCLLETFYFSNFVCSFFTCLLYSTVRGQYDCSVDFPFYSYGYIMVIPVFFKGARMIC